MSIGVQFRSPPAITVRPPAKGAFRFRSTVARIVRFLAWLIGTASCLLEVHIAQHHAAVALGVLHHPAQVQHRPHRGLPLGDALHLQRDVVDADVWAFDRIRLPLDDLQRHALRLARRVDGEGLRVAAGVQVELDRSLPSNNSAILSSGRSSPTDRACTP